jgi:hypothetical protein
VRRLRKIFTKQGSKKAHLVSQNSRSKLYRLAFDLQSDSSTLSIFLGGMEGCKGSLFLWIPFRRNGSQPDNWLLPIFEHAGMFRYIFSFNLRQVTMGSRFQDPYNKPVKQKFTQSSLYLGNQKSVWVPIPRNPGEVPVPRNRTRNWHP